MIKKKNKQKYFIYEKKNKECGSQGYKNCLQKQVFYQKDDLNTQIKSFKTSADTSPDIRKKKQNGSSRKTVLASLEL